MAGEDGKKIGDAYVEVHMDPDKAVDDAARKIESTGKKKLSKSGEKAGKDAGKGVIKGTLAGMDAGDGEIVKKSGEIGKKSGKEVADKAEQEIKRERPKLSAAAVAMFAGLPVAALGAGVATGAALAAVPLAFGAIAAVAQKDNRRVAESFDALADDVVTSTQEMTLPLAHTFVQVAQNTQAALDRMKPDLADIFSGLDEGILEVTDGVTDLAENALPGLNTAVDQSGPAFRALKPRLGQPGTGVSDFFTNLSDGAGASGEILDDTGRVIKDLLGFAGTLFAKVANQGSPTFDQFADMLHETEDAVLGLADGALPVLAAYTSTTLGMLNGMLRVLQPIAPALGTIGTSALTAKFGFGLLNAVSFGNLNKSLDGVKERVKAAPGPMAKMRASVGGLGSAAGIAGIASAGVGIAMGIMAAEEQKAAERAARLRDATEALSDVLEKGATTASSTYRQALIKVGAEIPDLNDALHASGTNLSPAADMAVKGGAAWDSYKVGLAHAKDEGISASVANMNLYSGLKELRDSTLAAEQANRAHELSLRGIAATGIPAVDDGLIAIAKSTGDADVATVAATKKTENLQAAMETLASSTGSVDAKMQALLTVMDTYSGRVAPVEEATQALNADMRSLKDMTKAWTDNVKGSQVQLDRGGKSLKDFTASLINADGTINTTTQTGSEFQDTLVGIQTDLYTQVTALHESGASHEELTKKVQTTRDAFIKQATQMGFTKQQAIDLANKYGLIPDEVTTSIEGNATSAMNAIGAVVNGLKGIKNKRVTVSVQADMSGLYHSLDAGQRFGVPFYASGTPSHPGGLSVVGEEGFELMRKGNSWALAPGPTLLDVPAGTEIVSHPQSEKMLSVAGALAGGRGSPAGVGGDGAAAVGESIVVNNNFYVTPEVDLDALASKVGIGIERRIKRGVRS